MRRPSSECDQPVLQHERGGEQRQHDVVEALGVEHIGADLRLGDRREAEIAAGYRHPFLQDLEDHPAERDGHHGEIGPAHAQRRKGEQRAEGRGDDGAGEHAEPDVQAGRREERERRQRLGQQRRGIGAHRHQCRMPERELSGIAGQDVQSDGDDAVDEHDDAEKAVIGALDEERQDHERREREPATSQAAGRGLMPAPRSAFPNSPSGLRKSARIISEKPRMSRMPV